MKRIDKLFIGLIFGAIPPICLFMSAVVVWFYFFQKTNPWFFALSGIFVGIFICLVYIKKLIRAGFDLPVWILVGTYLFYNVVIFGFFMGFPVFNLLAGIPAGYYFGNRMRYKNIPFVESKRISSRVSLFTSSVMFLICVASALLAIFGTDIRKELQGMLKLHFEVTEIMVWGIILVGGFTLIVFQYFITMATLSRILNLPQNQKHRF